MTTTTIQGIDISKHQGVLDHAKYVAAGMKFCVCKATEGVGYEDPKFASNISAIRAIGGDYYPGAYHFARPDTGGGYKDGVAEGEAFAGVVARVCGSIEHNFLPPALDFEKYSESDSKDNVPWIEGWISAVERLLKRQPMIYTGANVWKYEVGDSDKFTGYPLWQVYYSKTAKTPSKTPWEKWTFWQWSGGGEFAYAPPIDKVVDVNRFNGTLDDLRILANVSAPIVVPAPAPAPPAPVYAWPAPPRTADLGTSVYARRIEALLRVHGYNDLASFKRSCGLPADTTVDWETLWMLMLKI